MTLHAGGTPAPPVTSVEAVGGRSARLHLALLRIIARSGHVRRGATLIRPFFSKEDAAVVTFTSGGRMAIDLSDAHWSRVPAGLPYEPAVERILSTALAMPDTYLIDCGANIGYWSSRFASTTEVVAIEANPDVFAVLERHAGLNGFKALHSAIWSSADQTVEFSWDPDRHEAGAMADGHATSGARIARVATTTLDALHDEFACGRTAVVKLDVEGVEEAAIDGGARVLAGGLLVYEDHGQDRTHGTTSHVLERGFDVRWPHDDGSYEPINDVTRLDALKVKPRSGYNLVAFGRDSRWATKF